MCYVMHRQRGGSAVNRMTWSYVSKIYVRVSGKVLWLNIREYKTGHLTRQPRGAMSRMTGRTCDRAGQATYRGYCNTVQNNK